MLYDLCVQIAGSVRRDRTNCNSFVSGHAEFAGEEYVQRQVQSARDLRGNGDPAAWDSKHNCVRGVPEVGKCGCQLASSVAAVCEEHGHIAPETAEAKDRSKIR